MALGDPFDFSSADPNAPGFLGQSPGFWRDLASFGGNLAATANARTPDGHLAYGTGLAGPLGAAIGTTMQQGQQNAVTRSHLAAQGAATQGQVLQNQAVASGLPLTQAKNNMLLRIYQNPALMQQIMGGGPLSSGAPDGAPLIPTPAGQPDMAPVAHTLETNNSMAPGITGDGGAAAGPMQVHQGALDDVNRATGNNYTLDQVRADPMLGFRVGQAYMYLQQQRFPGRPDLALAAYNAGPTATSNAVAGGQGVAGLPDSTQSYVHRGMAQQPGQLNISPADGLGLAQRYEAQANQIELAHSMGLPVAGDPAALRTAAQQFRAMALAGPTEAAKADQQITTDRFGNRYRGTQYLGRGPEVREVFNPATGQYEWGDVGALGPNGQPVTPGSGQPTAPGSGGMVAKPGPGTQEYLQGPAKLQQSTIDHDSKMVDEDLAHVIENVTPAKQQLMQLRTLVDSANTGAAGDFRAAFKNWAQTFAPDFVSQITGDASPAQEFKKIALMGAGKQERGDLGARGGFRAIELYLHANPNLDMQPTANHDMANALLISHQYHEDYATGATDFYNKQYQNVQDQGTTKPYQSVKKYDAQFIQKMRPELYAAAIDAMNGKPYAQWSKGLKGPQLQIVGGILQRADPNAVIDLNGHQVPVSAFTTTISPTQLATGGANGG